MTVDHLMTRLASCKYIDCFVLYFIKLTARKFVNCVL